MTNPTENPWKTLRSTRIYDNRWITVFEDQVINPGGGQGIYGKVHFKNKAIGIVPIDAAGYTWLVGQYRYTLNAWSWEIPEGGGPVGTSPLEAAKRELQEETGLRAGKWTELMRIHTSNSVTDEEGLIFLAEDLEEGANNLEDSEADLVVKKIKLTDAVEMIDQGAITDSLSVAALLYVARMKGQNRG